MASEYDAPYVAMQEEELKGIVYNFATLCSLFENKHLSFQLVLSLVLSKIEYRNLLKKMMRETDDLKLFRSFLLVAPEVAASKYVSRMARLYVPSTDE